MGRDTTLFFSNDTQFKSLTTGDIVASNTPPLVYASREKAGLVQLADASVIRGALGRGTAGVSDKVAVTARDLAAELNIRFENAFSSGTGVIVTSQLINPPDGDPLDPTDDILQYSVSVDPNYGGFVPVGGIVMWSGSVGQVPTGWALCNGQTVEGRTTPNLANRFIKAVTVDPTPVSGGPTINASSSTVSLSTQALALEQRHIPRHQHAIGTERSFVNIRGGTDGTLYTNVVAQGTGDRWTGAGGGCNFAGVKCAPIISPLGVAGNSLGNSSGGVDGHAHAIGSHNHTVTSASILEPMWYALAFIMRVL
jgi:hypothetical protein